MNRAASDAVTRLYVGRRQKFTLSSFSAASPLSSRTTCSLGRSNHGRGGKTDESKSRQGSYFQVNRVLVCRSSKREHNCGYLIMWCLKLYLSTFFKRFRATQYACSLSIYLLRNNPERKDLVATLQSLEAAMSAGRKCEYI